MYTAATIQSHIQGTVHACRGLWSHAQYSHALSLGQAMIMHGAGADLAMCVVEAAGSMTAMAPLLQACVEVLCLQACALGPVSETTLRSVQQVCSRKSRDTAQLAGGSSSGSSSGSKHASGVARGGAVGRADQAGKQALHTDGSSGVDVAWRQQVLAATGCFSGQQQDAQDVSVVTEHEQQQVLAALAAQVAMAPEALSKQRVLLLQALTLAQRMGR